MREILDFLPPMPIDIRLIRETDYIGDNVNVIAALEHPDRVCMIHLYSLPSSLLERFTTVMQEPFPVLTDLRLDCPHDPTPLVLPDTFLGGSAPRLETLRLAGIPFPALPKLLLSARDLTSLSLSNIPHSGYFSPEAMVTALSGLTNLKYLTLEFQSPSSCTNRGSQRPPPLTRVDLPTLARLFFQGVAEYLEDFLVRINTPVITIAMIRFFNRVNFDIPQLCKFISRTVALGSVKRAELAFYEGFATLSIAHPDTPHEFDPEPDGFPHVGVSCNALDWQVSFLVQICSQLLPILSSVEELRIRCRDQNPLDWEDDLDHTQWLEIFRPFIAVQSLHIDGLDLLIAPALQELTGVRVMEVLPALRNLFVTNLEPSGSVRQTIEPFITARRLSNQPVTVQQWERAPLSVVMIEKKS